MSLSVGQTGAGSAALGGQPAGRETSPDQQAFGDLVGGSPAHSGKRQAAPSLGGAATLRAGDAAAQAPARGGDAKTFAAEITKDEPPHDTAGTAAVHRTAARFALRAGHGGRSDSAAERPNIGSETNPGTEIDADDPEPGALEASLDDESATGFVPPPASALNGMVAVTRLPYGITLLRHGSAPEDRLGAAGNGPAAGVADTPAESVPSEGKGGAWSTASSADPNDTAAHAAILLRRESMDQTTAQAASSGRERSSARLAQLTATQDGRHGSPRPGAEGPAYRIAAAEPGDVSGRTGRSRLEAQLSAGRTLASGAGVGAQSFAATEHSSDATVAEAEAARSDHRRAGTAATDAIGITGSPATRPYGAYGSDRSAGSAAADGQTDGAQPNAVRAFRRPGAAEPSGSARSPALPAGGEDNERFSIMAPNAASAASSLMASTPLTPVGTAPALAAGLASYPAWAGLSAPHPGVPPTAPAHSIRLELHPAELGMVTVSMKMTGEQLSIQLSVDTEEARSRLSTDADSIIKALRGLGFEVDQVTIVQSAVASSAGQAEAPPPGGSPQRDQQALFSGQSGNGEGGRAGRESRDGNPGEAPAHAAVHNSGGSGGGLYI